MYAWRVAFAAEKREEEVEEDVEEEVEEGDDSSGEVETEDGEVLSCAWMLLMNSSTLRAWSA